MHGFRAWINLLLALALCAQGAVAVASPALLHAGSTPLAQEQGPEEPPPCHPQAESADSGQRPCCADDGCTCTTACGTATAVPMEACAAPRLSVAAAVAARADATLPPPFRIELLRPPIPSPA